MPHSVTYDSIVLRCFDVGEADRFCILLTRERGRLAVRAPGVRRLLSRKGASLLPLQRVLVEVKEMGSGLFAVTTNRTSDAVSAPSDIDGFSMAEEGIEVLLGLVPDEQPLPDVFDETVAFLLQCQSDPSHTVVVAFIFRLLHLLGHLPESSSDFFKALNDDEKEFLEVARSKSWTNVPQIFSPSRLISLQGALLEDVISIPLKAGKTGAEMR